MRRTVMAFATVGCGLVLSGCASGPPPYQGGGYTPVNKVVYTCRSGEPLEVRYFPDQGVAVLVRDGRTQELQQHTSGSGIAYSGPGINLRSQGDTLRIEAPGQPVLECLAVGK